MKFKVGDIIKSKMGRNPLLVLNVLKFNESDKYGYEVRGLCEDDNSTSVLINGLVADEICIKATDAHIVKALDFNLSRFLGEGAFPFNEYKIIYQQDFLL